MTVLKAIAAVAVILAGLAYGMLRVGIHYIIKDDD